MVIITSLGFSWIWRHKKRHFSELLHQSNFVRNKDAETLNLIIEICEDLNNSKKKSLKIKESSVELHLKRGTVSLNLAIHGYENLLKSIHSAFADHLLL